MNDKELYQVAKEVSHLAESLRRESDFEDDIGITPRQAQRMLALIADLENNLDILRIQTRHKALPANLEDLKQRIKK